MADTRFDIQQYIRQDGETLEMSKPVIKCADVVELMRYRSQHFPNIKHLVFTDCSIDDNAKPLIEGLIQLNLKVTFQHPDSVELIAHTESEFTSDSDKELDAISREPWPDELTVTSFEFINPTTSKRPGLFSRLWKHLGMFSNGSQQQPEQPPLSHSQDTKKTIK